jgi:hypothetical protein
MRVPDDFRIPGGRPNPSLGIGGTNFQTTMPLRFEDFQGAVGTILSAQIGLMIGYGVGYAQISGQIGGRRWAAISEEGIARNTSFIWIGGIQTSNVGANVGGFTGFWTYTPGSSEWLDT